MTQSISVVATAVLLFDVNPELEPVTSLIPGIDPASTGLRVFRISGQSASV